MSKLNTILNINSSTTHLNSTKLFPSLYKSPSKSIKYHLLNTHGLGTLEVVVLIAILLAIALIFNENIRSFANKLFTTVFNDGRVIKEINQR